MLTPSGADHVSRSLSVDEAESYLRLLRFSLLSLPRLDHEATEGFRKQAGRLFAAIRKFLEPAVVLNENGCVEILCELIAEGLSARQVVNRFAQRLLDADPVAQADFFKPGHIELPPGMKDFPLKVRSDLQISSQKDQGMLGSRD